MFKIKGTWTLYQAEFWYDVTEVQSLGVTKLNQRLIESSRLNRIGLDESVANFIDLKLVNLLGNIL